MNLPFALAKRFVAAKTFDGTIPKIKSFNEKGIKVTLDLLGENVKEKTTADDTVEIYKQLLHKIHEAGLKSTISIKLTMLGMDIDQEYCKKNLFNLLDLAKELNSFVRIDMEGSDYTQQTIDIFKDAFYNVLETYGFPNSLKNIDISISKTEHVAVLGAAALTTD